MVSSVRAPRPYELMVIVVPDISDEEVTEALGRINGYIGDIEGTIREVLTDSPWGRRRLAYPIRFNSIDYRDGYYAVYHFDSRPEVMTDLERELKLDTRVVRYLLVHEDPKAGVQSANIPAEGSEEEGDRDRERRRPYGEDGRRPASERTRPVAAPAPVAPQAVEPAPAVESTPAGDADESSAVETSGSADAPVAETETSPVAESVPVAAEEVAAAETVDVAEVTTLDEVAPEEVVAPEDQSKES